MASKLWSNENIYTISEPFVDNEWFMNTDTALVYPRDDWQASTSEPRRQFEAVCQTFTAWTASVHISATTDGLAGYSMFPTAAKQWFQQKQKKCNRRWLPQQFHLFPRLSNEDYSTLCQVASSSSSSSFFSSSFSSFTGPELPALHRNGPCRTRTASSGAECSPPDINCKLMIALAPTGPEQQARDEKCSPPDLICKLVIAAVPAGPDQFPAGPHLQAGSRMFPTGPQLKTRERSGPRRTRTVTAGSKWSPPTSTAQNFRRYIR